LTLTYNGNQLKRVSDAGVDVCAVGIIKIFDGAFCVICSLSGKNTNYKKVLLQK
jgi:hypothetical protein